MASPKGASPRIPRTWGGDGDGSSASRRRRASELETDHGFVAGAEEDKSADAVLAASPMRRPAAETAEAATASLLRRPASASEQRAAKAAAKRAGKAARKTIKNAQHLQQQVQQMRPVQQRSPQKVPDQVSAKKFSRAGTEMR